MAAGATAVDEASKSLEGAAADVPPLHLPGVAAAGGESVRGRLHVFVIEDGSDVIARVALLESAREWRFARPFARAAPMVFRRGAGPVGARRGVISG